MPLPITVSDLIDQVRDGLDEQNTATISDDDILQSLNRAQDYSANLLVKQYPDPLVTFATVSPVSGQRSYDMPEDIFEDRLQKVEIIENGIAWEVKRISYRDVSVFESNSKAARPMYYYILGKKFYLIPTPAGGNRTIRYWYIKEVETLVKPQGRLTTIGTVTSGPYTGSSYVIVDSLGSDLTTVSDELKNYVNIVDAQTGDVKVSLEIQYIDTTQNKLIFKATPDRTTVWNRTISGSVGSDVVVDDYICLSRGNCIPYLKKPLSNFMITYSVVELKRRLGEATEAEERMLAKFEDQVDSQWAGRENQLRVKKRSRNWFSRFRRPFAN
jgi:hypothetical protein